jgi:hypothetical protein
MQTGRLLTEPKDEWRGMIFTDGAAPDGAQG